MSAKKRAPSFISTSAAGISSPRSGAGAGGQQASAAARILQMLFNWEDCHLHDFIVGRRVYSVPGPDDDRNERRIIDESGVPLTRIVNRAGATRKTPGRTRRTSDRVLLSVHHRSPWGRQIFLPLRCPPACSPAGRCGRCAPDPGRPECRGAGLPPSSGRGRPASYPGARPRLSVSAALPGRRRPAAPG